MDIWTMSYNDVLSGFATYAKLFAPKESKIKHIVNGETCNWKLMDYATKNRYECISATGNRLYWNGVYGEDASIASGVCLCFCT